MNYHSLPATYVSHVALNVSDIDRSLAFYEQLLGFHVLHNKDRIVSLTTNGVDAVITLHEMKNVPLLDRKASGMYHVAFLLPTRSDLAELYIHARNCGLLHEGVADHLVTESVYLSDPDGNGIEMYVDRDPSDWMWNDRYVAMDTIPLDTNDLMNQAKKKWEGMPADTIIGHIHLQIHEIEQTSNFYSDYFSFDIVNAYGGQAIFLSTANYHHHIGMNTWNSAGRKSLEEPHIGMRSFTFRMSEEKRQQAMEHLKASTFTVKDEQGMYTVTDPSGNVVLF